MNNDQLLARQSTLEGTIFRTTMTDKTEDMETENSKISDDHLVEEDARLFGTLNADLADAMSNALENKIRSSVVASMPMANEARVDKLVNSYLLPAYYRGIDVAEVYARRNVFSVSMYPPKRRSMIMNQFFSDEVLDEEVDTDIKMEDTIQDDERITAAKSLLQTNNENESPQHSLERLKAEIHQLRDRLQTTQMHRSAMQQSLAQTELAASLAQKVLDTNPSQISLDTVKAVVEVVPLLLRRQEEAKTLIQEMEEREKRRTIEEMQDAEQVIVLAKKRQHKQLGLLEQFERDLHQIGGDVTKLDWLQQVLVKSSD